MALHTRNLKYGKLVNGQFVAVPPALIKRTKQAFVTLPCDVDLILGNNGYIWISQHIPEELTPEDAVEHQKKEVTFETRQRICRVRNAIVTLATMFIAIYPATIMDTYEESEEHNLQPQDMLKPNKMELITVRAGGRKKKE
eukprot:TRINITY_DN3266_c0_g1_i2.p1 TRINITY_DN3266_c0_g1~~TRINITY_DN3266_c0_g1_i2.p1  ORF type:complete len:141 (+),score=16.11 TRINITY_DN3266_c0_g1_i2:127-549(+)